MTDQQTDLLIYETLKLIAVELSRHTEALKDIQMAQASILEQLKRPRKAKERLSDKIAPFPKLELVRPASGQKNDPSGDPEGQASHQKPKP